MRRLAASAALILLLATGRGASAETRSAAQLRHLSFAVNDSPPSREEAQRFSLGAVTAEQLIEEWLAGDRHRARIRRFFYDLFGTQDFGQSGGAGKLRRNSAGIYELEQDKPGCGPDEAAQVGAWWLEPGQTVPVCKNAIAGTVDFGSKNQPGYHNCTYGGALSDPRCGCGPDLILCVPQDRTDEMARAAYLELIERGLWAYESDRSWFDLLAANQFYGTRYDYYVLLWRGWIQPFANYPSAADMRRLKSLPVDRRAVTEFPEQGAERAPIVTSASFMHQYNNFRSRIRVLSERLLCQPITPVLNTDGIRSFVNPDLKDSDRSHATRTECASCHHALDNLGSTLLGWQDGGTYDPHAYSQLGHVFGQTGTGPRFLMRGFIERGPGFGACMARRAWESFAGTPFADLPEADRKAFEQLAASGPRALFRGVLTSPALRRAR